jgi:Ca-activated chloride channel homolog
LAFINRLDTQPTARSKSQLESKLMTALLDLHFIRPAWLLALIPALILYWQMWKHSRTHKGWSHVIDEQLLPHLLVAGTTEGKSSPIQIVLLGWILGTLAMAGPSWEKIPQPVQRKQDALVVLLDLSQSMLTQDLSPSRLQRARRKLRDLVKLRTEGTTALIAYAGDAHVVSPLTGDTRTIANLIPALSPGMMPLPGADAAAAVELALELFHSAGHLEGQILLLTDGIRPDRRKQITQLLQGGNYSLSIIGVGTGEGGPIPTPEGLLKDRSGAIVLARLERSSLQSVANESGGTYRDISLDDSDLDKILPNESLPEGQVQSDINDNDDSRRSADSWHDAGYWLVLLCLPLALGSFRKGWVQGAALLLVLPAQPSYALEWQDLWQTQDQQAAKLLEQGDPQAAAAKFQDPDWIAAAHYRAEKYEEAEKKYANRDDAKAWYNRGNARARGGDIPAAIAAYEEALQREPGMEDAIFNKELLEKIQDQQQEQEQQQDQDQEQDQEQDQQQQEQQSQDQESSENDQQEQEDSESQNSDQENSEQQEQEQEQEQEKEKEQKSEEEQQEEREEQKTQAQQTDEQDEEDRATEQWLRQVPDDPAGLLRRKFQYESQLREQRGEGGKQDNDW